MIAMTLTVSFEDGTETVLKVKPVTQVAFERAHNCSIVAVGEERRIGHVYWLAWHAATKGHGDGLDAWLETVEDIEVEVQVPDPTSPAPPAG